MEAWGSASSGIKQPELEEATGALLGEPLELRRPQSQDRGGDDSECQDHYRHVRRAEAACRVEGRSWAPTTGGLGECPGGTSGYCCWVGGSTQYA
jgi:hypothetical protein